MTKMIIMITMMIKMTKMIIMITMMTNMTWRMIIVMTVTLETSSDQSDCVGDNLYFITSALPVGRCDVIIFVTFDILDQ